MATDDGTEFKGQLLQYLEENGITKIKGFPYQHSYPGKVERSHQTIMRLGRAMLHASKLPKSLYAEAQLTAAYLYNRYVHGTDSKTPYEYVYGRKPYLSHLRPFGCVCYANIPIEVVEDGKLGNSGEKCRMIGYGDDDDVEEVPGYKLLRESDMTIFYSRDVVFDENCPMTPLIQKHLIGKKRLQEN